MTSAYSITPTLLSLYAALIPLITTVTGLSETQVIRGMGNRVPMPLPNFVNVQALSRSRIATDVQCPDTTSQLPTTMGLLQSIQYNVQIDCYGPQSSLWSDMLSTILRSEQGVNLLAPNCAPLYADDARMIPLVDGEQQWEERWCLDAAFEVDSLVTAPQQYADALTLQFISVQEAYGVS